MSKDDTVPEVENDTVKNFSDIVKNYEQLIKCTQQELEFYKNEQTKLKCEVLKILETNQVKDAATATCPCQQQQQQQCPCSSENISEEHEKLTNEAISNLKGQIRHLNEERNVIHELWKTSQETIETLEKEICSYRSQLLKPNSSTDIKKRYIETIQVLENTVKTLRCELSKQSNLNKNTIQCKQDLEKRLKCSEEKCREQEQEICTYKNFEKTNADLKNQLSFLNRANCDLEKSLNVAKQIIDERFCREKEALRKVDEALCIADRAIAEKEEAEKKEKIVREECCNLAKTIGQVMEDAANKVEKDIGNIKRKYEEEIRTLKNTQKETLLLLENQKKLTHLVEVRAKALENKLKDSLQDNVTLDTDLQVASQAIIEMELKLEAVEQLMDKDKKSKKICDEKEQALKEFLQNNKKLKDRWKQAVEEVTKRFKNEICALHKENTALKIEVEELNLKLSQQK